MTKLLAFAVLALAATAAAKPFSSVAPVSGDWEITGAAAPDALVRVEFRLQPTNFESVTKIATMVSDPDHPSYTQYLTRDEVNALAAPAVESATAVTSWLEANHIAYQKHVAGDRIVARMPVKAAEQLLGATFQNVRNAKTQQFATRTDSISLPDEVAPHVAAVFGVHGLPLPPRNLNKKKTGAPDPAQVTPEVITNSYGVSGVKGSGSTKNVQAVAEFQGQFMSQTDLTKFFSMYVKGSSDDKVNKYVGSSTQGEGIEANLDIQYIMGVAPGILTDMYAYGGQDFCADLSQWTGDILSETDAPNVFSVSYGWQGEMSQIGCTNAQITSIDGDFQKIAARGITIIFASGDSGSAFANTQCYASWPASSAWVTAVGATRFINNEPSTGPERSVDQFGSGGGFSFLVTPAPEYQADATAGFFKAANASAIPQHGMFNKKGRATPDVAALGEGFQVIENGSPMTVGGTSASAPTFAAIVSLLNEARINGGGKPLGFLNTWLYKTGKAGFQDVTVGSDKVGRGGQTLPYGYDCEVGWDPVTGFGTPLFGKLLKMM